jgi:hypothetical protein
MVAYRAPPPLVFASRTPPPRRIHLILFNFAQSITVATRISVTIATRSAAVLPGWLLDPQRR